MAYTIVAGCVLVLRYQPLGKTPFKSSGATSVPDGATSGPGGVMDEAMTSQVASETMTSPDVVETDSEWSKKEDKKRLIINTEDFGKVKPLFKFLRFLDAQEAGSVVPQAVVVMTISMFGAGALLNYGLNHLRSGLWWAVCLLVVSVSLMVTSFATIFIHVQNDCYGSFKVPFVPFLPCLSIFLNVLMMVQLSSSSWWRFIIWMIIGFVIYFAYGIRHSKENEDSGMYGHLLDKAEKPPEKTASPAAGNGHLQPPAAGNGHLQPPAASNGPLQPPAAGDAGSESKQEPK